MFDALIAGQRDGQVLAELALGRLRKKIPALTEALVGRVDDHHAFLARMICDHIDTISRMIAELNARIEREIEPYRAEVELLDSLPGVDTRTAEVIIAEIGTDMSRFPIATRLASWAGACPATTRPAAKVNPATLAPATVGSKPPSASPRWGAIARRTPTPTPCSAALPLARRQKRPRRGRAQPARLGLACPGHQNRLPRPRRRLLPHPRQP